MGEKDIVTKDYIEDPLVFADAFNYLIYGGKPVIDPSRLYPLDSTVIGILPYGEKGAKTTVQKYRDSLKYLTAKEDDRAVYLLLGLESQSEGHMAMPVRNMVYDALQYARQVEETAKSHKKAAKETTELSEKKKSLTSVEYLGGFYKEDRLVPVITLVLYFDAKGWEGPRRLHEMLSVQDPQILSFVPDYAINLIGPGMSEEEIEKFHTDLKQVLLFIKYSGDKEKINRLVASDEKYRELDIKAARVIRAITGSKLKFDKKEKKVDMSNALDEIWEDGKREGEVLKTISLIQKKTEKNIAPALIADMLEEELVFIEQICHLIQKYPEADKEALFDYWTAQQKGS